MSILNVFDFHRPDKLELYVNEEIKVPTRKSDTIKSIIIFTNK